MRESSARKGGSCFGFVLLASLATFSALSSGQEIQSNPEKIGDTESLSIESPHPYRALAEGPGVVWSAVVGKRGATFVRVRFSDRTSLADELADSIVVRDAAGTVVRVYRGNEAAGRWTPTSEGEEVTVELVAAVGGGYGIEIDEAAWGTAPLFPAESATAGTGFFDICSTSVPSRIRTADPVARLIWTDDCGGVFTCSGWLFSVRGHLMTNAHCANSQSEGNNLEVHFNHMNPTCDLPGPPNPDRYDAPFTNPGGIEFRRMNCNLDYSVFLVDDPGKTPRNPAERYGFLDISLLTPDNDSELWLPQHPGGARKQIAEDCSVNDNSESGFNGCGDPPLGCDNMGFAQGSSDLSFNCAIAGGSSGSPVLNTSDKVVALAHASSPSEGFGVRMNAIASDLPNEPVSLSVTGPMTVNEGQSAQFTSVASFLLTADRSVTNSTEWFVAAASAGMISASGLFQAAEVTSDRTTTISGTFTHLGQTVVGSARITILNVPKPIAIVSSNPPEGAIDAGQPTELDGTGAFGWQSIDLVFDGPVAELTPASFSVILSLRSDTSPQVEEVTMLSPESARIDLDRPIYPGFRITLTHLPSETSTSLGFLPADVDESGTSDPADADVLVSALTAIAGGSPNPLPLTSSDLNRSLGVNPLDLVREVDLLIGAGEFMVWNGISLP